MNHVDSAQRPTLSAPIVEIANEASPAVPPFKNFRVVAPDEHGLDRNNYGIGRIS